MRHYSISTENGNLPAQIFLDINLYFLSNPTGIVLDKKDESKIEYHDNGVKKSEEHYKDGIRNGSFIRWYDNGNKESECSYKDGVLHGTSNNWYANGNKESESHYNYGDPLGIWREWHDDGSRKYEERYKNGKLNGVATGWYDSNRNGKKNYEDIYQDHKLIKTTYY